MAKKEEESAQINLINKIKESLPANISFVDDLAELLNVSVPSVYRRFRGETSFTVEELALICRHYRFSFDAFIDNTQKNYVNFSYHQLNSHNNTFKEYLSGIKNGLDNVLRFPENDRQIIFAAEDIPVFQHFAHPYLTAFKIYYWNKSILNAKGFEENKFDTAYIDTELQQIAADIYERYAKINSIEVWSDDTITSTLKQIEFYWDAGAFKNKEDASKVCGELGLLFERINKQAEMNVKLDKNGKPASSEPNYALYHSDVMIGNNCVLSVMGDQKGAYISYHTFNSMLTTNTNFCNETDLWLKNLIKKSNLISGAGEKSRYRFFKKANEALKKLTDKIEND